MLHRLPQQLQLQKQRLNGFQHHKKAAYKPLFLLLYTHNATWLKAKVCHFALFGTGSFCVVEATDF
jgi:hypothetical protein